MTENLIPWGRLALRVEGDNWNAYYAPKDTMVGAIFIASLNMKIASKPEHKKAFMGLVQAGVSDVIAEMVGKPPEWETPVAALEHERGGNA